MNSPNKLIYIHNKLYKLIEQKKYIEQRINRINICNILNKIIIKDDQLVHDANKQLRLQNKLIYNKNKYVYIINIFLFQAKIQVEYARKGKVKKKKRKPTI